MDTFGGFINLVNIIIFHQHVMCLCSVKWCEVVVATLLDDKGHPIWILCQIANYSFAFSHDLHKKGRELLGICTSLFHCEVIWAIRVCLFWECLSPLRNLEWVGLKIGFFSGVPVQSAWLKQFELKKKILAIGMTKSPYGCSSTCPESRDTTWQETQYYHEYIRLSYNADWIQKPSWTAMHEWMDTLRIDWKKIWSTSGKELGSRY